MSAEKTYESLEEFFQENREWCLGVAEAYRLADEGQPEALRKLLEELNGLDEEPASADS